MELITELRTKTPQEITYFDYLTMDIVPEGLLVKAKSKVFADWIKAQGIYKDTLSTPALMKLKSTSYAKLIGPPDLMLYQPLDKWNYGMPYGLAQWGFGDYFGDEKPNLMWLFHPELETGCEFLFRTPISLNNWEDYFTSCCKSIQDIWCKELRTASISATFKELVVGVA